MPNDKDVIAKMDAATEAAEKDLEALVEDNPDAVRLVAKWWEHHFRSSGHKRLARALLDHAPNS